MLIDSFARRIVSLRISVTDRCNLRCSYCIPHEEVEWLPRRGLLSFEEIERFVRIASRLGVRKVRVTGGEPLLRRGIADLLARLVAVPGIEDVGLTTNGIALPRLARPLRSAGLRRLNVSLDALDRMLYARMTRRDALESVLEGLRAAREAGFAPIKINAVVQRSANLCEVLPLARFARREGFIVRFIEYMPIGLGEAWRPDEVVSNAEILRILRPIGRLEPVKDPAAAAPARRWRWADGGGELGLIGSVTEPFCDSCNRVRITADGKLRTCLFSVAEDDVRGPMRSGASDAEIAEIIRAAVARKEPGHRIGRADFIKPPRTMSAIGG